MRVWRVMDAVRGHGPYEGGDVVEMGMRTTASKRHPMPYQDGLFVPRGDYRFGFASLAQYRQWFNERERTKLGDHGFVLAEYDADEVHHGGRQVVFNHDKARLVAIHDTNMKEAGEWQQLSLI